MRTAINSVTTNTGCGDAFAWNPAYDLRGENLSTIDV
jgi:hypothetical protein